MEKGCNNCRFELYNPDEIPCKDCGMDNREYWMPKPQANADRIRAMSDDELAMFFGRSGFCNGIIPMNYCIRQKVCSHKCVVNWLRQPAEEMPSEMNEDQDHPLRWSECNGVEAERCPVCKGE